MPKIKNVEKRIWEVEGFDVKIMSEDGQMNIRGDKDCLIQYPYERAASDDTTVSEWKTNRFKKTFANYEVQVLKSDNTLVSGQMKIGTVRDTYA
jgi:hypothetical protein